MEHHVGREGKVAAMRAATTPSLFRFHLALDKAPHGHGQPHRDHGRPTTRRWPTRPPGGNREEDTTIALDEVQGTEQLGGAGSSAPAMRPLANTRA